MPRAMEVWMERLKFLRSSAPKKRPVKTLVPTAKPPKTLIIREFMGAVEPTAAMASWGAKWPMTTRSMAWKIS